MTWSMPVTALKGVGQARGAALASRGIDTLMDLLLLLPRGYRAMPPVYGDGKPLAPRTEASLFGVVRHRRRGKLRRSPGGFLDIRLRTPAGLEIPVLFFNQSYLHGAMEPGTGVAVAGRMDSKGAAFVAKAHARVSTEQDARNWASRLLPRWPPIPGVSAGVLARLMGAALDAAANLPDPMPGERRAALGLPSLSRALHGLHRPDDIEDARRGLERVAFDRMLARLLPLRTGSRPQQGAPRIPCPAEVMARIVDRLPFPLTADQKRVLAEILADMDRDRPMRRLLMGDVGTGKTAVAVAAALAAVAAKRQVLLLAPTEALAWQHHQVIESWLGGSRVRTALLTGRDAPSARRAASEGISAGRVHIACGTHALLSGPVRFPGLGLVIVDEQHKFGVMQRLRARLKGAEPHILGMSATPIPRSLCLALLRHLDQSVLRVRPENRQPAPAVALPGEEAFPQVRAAAARGERAYVVFPAISADSFPCVEREGRALFAAGGPLESISYRVLHGGIPPEERREALGDFIAGRASALLCTQIVEVGIDVPEATLMVVCAPDRFGLSTLHQLRGRVGRGSRPGRCLLLVDRSLPPAASSRLGILERETDGLRIAEEDLRLRGPGELAGVLQSGFEGGFDPGSDREWDLLALAEAELESGAGYDLGYYTALAGSLELLPALPADAV